MKIFIDFDDVLFNTKKFRQDFINIFLRQGISRKDFDATYAFVVGKDSGCKTCYDPKKHIVLLRKMNLFDDRKLEKSLKVFLSNLGGYVFGDVLAFLEKFKKKELFLLTFGDIEFQKSKIKGAGVKNYFSKVIISDKKKSEGIAKAMVGGRIFDDKLYFIDDRAEHISDVKRKNPKIKTILLKRREGCHRDRKNKYCDFECGNLAQVKKIIFQKNAKQK